MGKKNPKNDDVKTVKSHVKENEPVKKAGRKPKLFRLDMTFEEAINLSVKTVEKKKD